MSIIGFNVFVILYIKYEKLSSTKIENISQYHDYVSVGLVKDVLMYGEVTFVVTDSKTFKIKSGDYKVNIGDIAEKCTIHNTLKFTSIEEALK
jgi:hypothetical protein